jgi:hypothetical protein
MSVSVGPTEMEMEMEMEMGAGLSINMPGLPVASPIVRPMGVSPSCDKSNGKVTYRGRKWPPLNVDHALVATPNVWQWEDRAAPKPPLPAWAPQFDSISLLADFLQVKIEGSETEPAWPGIDLSPSDEFQKDLQKSVRDELRYLIDLMDYRPGVLAEALAQANAIDGYFRGVLTFTRSSHPKTYLLMQTALRIGEFQVMHHKRKFNRPRPSQLTPLLMPPIEVPGHASYPSGHATQAHLVAYVLEKVMPEVIANSCLLRSLARRIARNREVLGLHYPSDSSAGKTLAEKSFTIMCRSQRINALIEDARHDEWGHPRVPAQAHAPAGALSSI